VKWLSGIISLSSSVDPERVGSMLSQVPDCGHAVSQHQVVDTHAGFGVAYLSDLPAETDGVLFSDELLIAGDIALHNRAELQRLVGGLPNTGAPMDDKRLVAELYRRYGLQMVDYLVGEFSILLWDSRRRGLLAVRDPMGIATLFYRLVPGGLEVASDLSLFGCPCGVDDMDKEYFAEYVRYQGMMDTARTPYRGVFRIPRGTRLWFDQDGVAVHRYWDLAKFGANPLRYRREDEYSEHLRELIIGAVGCRLLKDCPNAVMMSGGLDSTSIYAVARGLERRGQSGPVIPVSAVFDRHRSSDERSYMDAVLKMHGGKRVDVPADDLLMWRDFPRDPWSDEPLHSAPSYAFYYELLTAARREGAESVLSGHAGDHLFSGDAEIISDMLRSRLLQMGLRSTWAYAHSVRESALKIFWVNGLKPLLVRTDTTPVPCPPSLVSASQRNSYQQFYGTTDRVFTDLVVARYAGVRLRHPFLDQRLWEFMMRVPGHLRWRYGVTKYGLRQAMRGLLPAVLLNRIDKSFHEGIIYEGLQKRWLEVWAGAQGGYTSNLGLTSKERLLSSLAGFRQGQLMQDDLWAILSVEHWLYKAEIRMH
jgi:asparagine synthase (glutamine-hydrolysing)